MQPCCVELMSTKAGRLWAKKERAIAPASSFRTTGQVNAWSFNYRLRRDKPDWKYDGQGNAKPDKKYLGPPRSANRLYIPPGVTPDQLGDLSIPIALCEGEKKALALWRLAWHETEKPRFVPIAIAGVWNWRGTVGQDWRTQRREAGCEGPHRRPEPHPVGRAGGVHRI